MTGQAKSGTSPALLSPRNIRVTAAVVFMVTVGFWAIKGAHTGWSMNQVPHKQTDEITGIEYVTYEQRFVPGVEFLGGGGGLAAGLFALSFFFNRKSINPSK